jgi:hypothetical protein
LSIRRLLVAIAGASSLAAATAFAAGLTTTSARLASGTDTVARCDLTPTFTYAFLKNASGQVTSVTVSDIDAGCAGAKLSLAVRPAEVTGGPVTVVTCAATCAATVPLTSSPLPAQVTSVVAVMVGP